MILVQSCSNPDAISERDCPPAVPSSIYPGGLVHRLHLDCCCIEDCGLCNPASSSYIPLVKLIVGSWNSGAIGERTAPGTPRPTYTLVLYSPAVCSPIGVGFRDCFRIVWGFWITLWFCLAMQSHSSSLYPSTICSAWIAGMCQDFLNPMGLCRRNVWLWYLDKTRWLTSCMWMAPKCSELGSIWAFHSLIDWDFADCSRIVKMWWNWTRIAWLVLECPKLGCIAVDPSLRQAVAAICMQSVQFWCNPINQIAIFCSFAIPLQFNLIAW